jgi:uncharacterized protein (DUF3084 family)
MDEEASKRINEKLDIILREVREINAKLNKAFEKYESIHEEEKVDEHVNRSDESVTLVDDESREQNFESISGKNEQRPIDQKATKLINKFRRVAKSRRRRKSPSTKTSSSKVSAEFACEVHSRKLKLVPLKIFRRKKKYKCDDGG